MELNTDLITQLQSHVPPGTHSSLCTAVIPCLLQAIADIAKTLRGSQRISLAGTANSFGDDQLNVDVDAENIIRAAIAKCPSIATASSEEDPVERPVNNAAASGSTSDNGGGHGESGTVQEGEERYTVAFDPLDGSSIIASNWSVGTIIGIWTGATALGTPPSTNQIASILGVLGPRTTAVVALRVPGAAGPPVCLEVGLGERGLPDAEVVRPRVRLDDPPTATAATRYFSPANLRAAAEDERYMVLVRGYVGAGYALRYSGGLVPDVCHALSKGHGVYVSPVAPRSRAKLRRLYELCPVALVVECAGGLAVDPADGQPVLGRAVGNCDERAGLICGTAGEVEKAVEALVS